jgi:hypothetical protein
VTRRCGPAQSEAEAGAAVLVGLVPGFSAVGAGETADNPQAESAPFAVLPGERVSAEAFEEAGAKAAETPGPWSRTRISIRLWCSTTCISTGGRP